MDKAKAPSASYLTEQSPEAIEANRRYQEALAKLTESLDTRKNQFFDPVWLAAAQGFAAPTQTGGFGESFGNAAKSIGAAQELESKREQEIAQQRLGAAGQGVELQRMKERDAALSKYLDGSGVGPQPAPVAAPRAGPLSTPLPASPEVPEAPTGPGALSRAAAPSTTAPSVPVVGSPQGALTAMEANKPPGFEGIEGIQVAPANPSFMTGRDYVRLNRSDRTKSPGDLIKEGQEIEQKRYRDKEGGVLDLATGKFYQYPSGKQEEVTIHGYPGLHKIDARVAAKLSLLGLNNDPAYHELARQVMQGPPRPVSEGKSEEKLPLRKSLQEMAIEQKEAESRASKLGEADAKKESSLSDTKATASRVYGSATRVLNSLKESPNFFGIFERTGYGPAILGAVDAGIRTQSGSISIGDLQSAVTKVMPNVSQKDLDNVKKAAAELAEIELQYTKLYVSGDGAITEGERKIVRAIPGTVSSSPEVLRTRMELLKSRAQFDLDVADAFEQWQDKNPGRPYREFERKSSLYKDIKKGFEEETEKMFGGIKAVPTRQRKEEAASGSPSSGFIRDPKTGVIRRKKEGE